MSLLDRSLLSRIHCIACAFLSALFATTLMGADPSVSKPNLPVPVHGLVEDAKKLFAQAEKDDALCTQLYTQMKKSGPKPDAVGKLATGYKRLIRNAMRLKDFGESSGSEFLARSRVHRKEFEECFYAFAARPEAAKFRAQAVTILQKGIQKRIKKAQEIAKLSAKDVFEAEAMMDQALDELEAVAGILDAPERGPFGELIDVDLQLKSMTSSKRQELTNAAIDNYCKKTAIEVETFLSAVPLAAKSIQDGSTTWNEKQIDSVSFLETMFREGFALQSHIDKALAYQSMLVSVARNAMEERTSFVPIVIDPAWTDRLTRLKTTLGTSAVTVIENDSKGLKPDSAKERFASYVKTLGKFAARVSNDEWIKMFDDAIAKASAQVNGAPKVDAYQLATNDLLRWKERIAARNETKLRGKTPALSAVIVAAATKNETDPGYFQTGPGSKPYPEFLHATFESLPTLSAKLGNESFAIANQVVHLDTEDPVWVSRWDNYIYARLPKKFLQSQQLQALERSLMTNSNNAALSVRAASALYTAERGDNLTVGGSVSDVYVEGAVARIVLLPEMAAPFFAIDYPVNLPRDQPNTIASIRAAIKPRWYRHRYFVATVPDSAE